MNRPSSPPQPPEHEGWNQSPSKLALTRQDSNGMVNLKSGQDSSTQAEDSRIEEAQGNHPNDHDPFPVSGSVVMDPPSLEDHTGALALSEVDGGDRRDRRPSSYTNAPSAPRHSSGNMGLSIIPSPSLIYRRIYAYAIARRRSCSQERGVRSRSRSRSGSRDGRSYKLLVDYARTGRDMAIKYGKFIGPGFMISVAYIDPGNYSTDVSAGAYTKFKLLFIVLMSNIFAIVLQSLAVRLGTVTGLNLAENCKEHLPPWLNFVLWVLGELAIIATDIAEVIGSAIALDLLFGVPLVAGCAITLCDVLLILLFYNPGGSMRRLRAFEYFVMALVWGVVICFCLQLRYIEGTTPREVFRGYLPSSTVVQGQGLYLSCGILGATVMPHSLYLGSGMVQPRLRDFDMMAGNIPPSSPTHSGGKVLYRPSVAAIQSCLKYSTFEVAISLFTFALFVNSAILIVAGASLSSESAAQSGDLFGVYDLLSKTLAPVAGKIFAVALLLSGTSAGIVCTIAGQILSEGALNWTCKPWFRRLITRSISITPSIIIAGAVGRDGLSTALNATQYALSVILPFVSAPLIYFTCRNKFMIVGGADAMEAEEAEPELRVVKMRNPWLLSGFAVLIWLVIAIMNVASLALLGLGKS